MRFDVLSIADIRGGQDDNPRKTFRGIEALAESIAELGQLENLIVAPRPGGGYDLKAGERRYRAIRRLVEEGRHDGQVHCIIIDTSGDLEALAENEGHHSVLPWETGDRYNELCERGYTQKEIAQSIGVTQQRISQYARIALGLSEKARIVLGRMPTALTMQQIEHVASLTTADGVPDEAAQVRALDRILSPRKKRKRSRRDLDGLKLSEHLLVRYKSLKYHVTVPTEARNHVDAVLRFLDGTDKHLDLSAWGVERI